MEIVNSPEKTDVRRFICVGIYIGPDGDLKPFIPELTISVYHGDDELLPDTTTSGYVDLPLDRLPQESNGSTGFNTDSKGKYIFYTAEDGRQVKIYNNADSLWPQGAEAYYVKSGFLPSRNTSKFSALGLSSSSYNEELLAKNKIANSFLQLNG